MYLSVASGKGCLFEVGTESHLRLFTFSLSAAGMEFSTLDLDFNKVLQTIVVGPLVHGILPGAGALRSLLKDGPKLIYTFTTNQFLTSFRRF